MNQIWPLKIIPGHPIISFILFYLIISFIIYLIRPFIFRFLQILIRFFTKPLIFLIVNLQQWLYSRRINFFLYEWRNTLEEIKRNSEEKFKKLTASVDRLYGKVLEDEEFEELNNSFEAIKGKLQNIIDQQPQMVNQMQSLSNFKERKKYLNKLDELFDPIEELLKELQEKSGDINEILQLIKDSQILKEELKRDLDQIEKLESIKKELENIHQLEETNKYIRQIRRMTDNKELERLLREVEQSTSGSSWDNQQNLINKLKEIMDENEQIHKNHIRVRAKIQELHDLLQSRSAEWQKRSLFVEFIISLILILVFTAVVYVNYHLLEAPLSDFMPGGFIFGGFRVSHLVAMVFVILEFVVGFLFFEFAGLTHLLSRVVGRAKGISRNLLIALFLFLIFVFAATEGFLSYYRTVILEQSTTEPGAPISSFFSKSPAVMGMVGFFLPLVLSALGVVIDPFLQSIRLILIALLFFVVEIILLVFRLTKIIIQNIPIFIDKILALIAFIYIIVAEKYKKWRAQHAQKPSIAS